MDNKPRKRWWSGALSREIESPAADAFLAEIAAVMAKHGIEIEHEDGHGAFVLTRTAHGGSSWIEDAHLEGEGWVDP